MTRHIINTVIFDMDGTIAFRNTHDASYDSFFRYMGLEKEMERITEKYHDSVRNVMTPENHKLQFTETVALLKGKSAPASDEVFSSIPYARYFPEFCQYLYSRGVNMGIVTLSLLYAADRIKEENNIRIAYANDIHVEDGRFTGTGKIHVLFGSKGDMVRKAYESLGGSKETTAYIGDSLNDVDCWNAVALPLGVNLHHPDCKKYVHDHFEDFYGVLEFFKKHVRCEKSPGPRI